MHTQNLKDGRSNSKFNTGHRFNQKQPNYNPGVTAGKSLNKPVLLIGAGCTDSNTLPVANPEIWIFPSKLVEKRFSPSSTPRQPRISILRYPKHLISVSLSLSHFLTSQLRPTKTVAASLKHTEQSDPGGERLYRNSNVVSRAATSFSAWFRNLLAPFQGMLYQSMICNPKPKVKINVTARKEGLMTPQAVLPAHILDG